MGFVNLYMASLLVNNLRILQMASLYKTVPHIDTLPVIKIDLVDCLRIDPSLPRLISKNTRPKLDFKLPFMVG